MIDSLTSWLMSKGIRYVNASDLAFLIVTFLFIVVLYFAYKIIRFSLKGGWSDVELDWERSFTFINRPIQNIVILIFIVVSSYVIYINYKSEINFIESLKFIGSLIVLWLGIELLYAFFYTWFKTDSFDDVKKFLIKIFEKIGDIMNVSNKYFGIFLSFVFQILLYLFLLCLFIGSFIYLIKTFIRLLF